MRLGRPALSNAPTAHEIATLTALSAHAAIYDASNAISGATVMTAQIVYLHRPRRFAYAYRIGRAFRVARYIVEGVGWVGVVGLIVGHL